MDDNETPQDETQAGAEQRRHERNAMLLSATVRTADGHGSFEARVRNLSAAGLMGELKCETHGAFPRGSRVVVQLRNLGWVAATVAWAVDHRFGLAFDRDIDPQVVRQVPVAAAVQPNRLEDMMVRRPLVIGKPKPHEPEPRPTRYL